ncbi:MAG: hypothetical protein WCO29_07790, partial [Nostocales cyanobacterium ELA583]
ILIKSFICPGFMFIQQALDNKKRKKPIIMRPHPGKPDGKTQWREVKVAILSRLGQGVTRHGLEAQVIAKIAETIQLRGLSFII